jgi:hypothetical protein
MTKLGVRFWDGLHKTGSKLLENFDEIKVNSILQKFIGNRKLSKQNLKDGNDILNIIEENNINIDTVSSYSNRVESNSETVKSTISLFNQMSKENLDTFITLGTSGNQKKLNYKDIEIIRKVFKRVKEGQIPSQVNVDRIYSKINDLNRKFKVIKL